MGAGEITRALQQLHAGETSARETLIQLVYEELRKIAIRQLKSERANHTLQPTALVNEAYLRLLGTRKVAWENRAHFFGAAATAMRHILVDHARAIRAQRRGGGLPVLSLGNSPETAVEGIRIEEILQVNEALNRLSRISTRQKTIVEMRFYAGFTEEEIAGVLQISNRTVKREWALARAWLHGECFAQPKKTL